MVAATALVVGASVLPAGAGLGSTDVVSIGDSVLCISQRETYGITWTVTNESPALPEGASEIEGILASGVTVTIDDAQLSGLASGKVEDLIGKELGPQGSTQADTFVLNAAGKVRLTVDYTISDGRLEGTTGQAVHEVDLPGECFPVAGGEDPTTTTSAAAAPATATRVTPAFTG
jgi:hypothetical protein